MTQSEDVDDRDAAWVTLETPFDIEWLMAFVGDVERVFRINSLMEYSRFDVFEGGIVKLEGKNLSTGKLTKTDGQLKRLEDGVEVLFESGIKSSTRFQVAAGENNTSQLVIIDDYSGTSKAKREARLDEVDNSLVRWGHDIQRYLRQWKRWSGVPGWTWYMQRVWLPMRPMARRIVFFILAITALEFIVFLAVFVIFWLKLNS